MPGRYGPHYGGPVPTIYPDCRFPQLNARVDTLPGSQVATSAPIVFCAPETAPGVRIEVVDLWSRVSGAWKGLS